MDLHTRRLRYFLAVADELHFGRAAAGQYVAQQAISRQVRELERELGVRLFSRTSRKVALTAAGAEFAEVARRVLADLDAGVERARSADRERAAHLRVGFRMGAALELTQPILAAMAAARPEIRIDLEELPFSDPWGSARGERAVDVAIVRGPFAPAGLRYERLYAEPLVAAVAAGHPLAGHERLDVAELAGETIVVGDSPDAAWLRYWSLEDQLGPRPDRLVRTSSWTEEIEMVAAGVACSITVAGAARFLPRPGVVFVPIDGPPPCETGLAWDPARRNRAADAFVTTALEVRDANPALVAAIERPA